MREPRTSFKAQDKAEKFAGELAVTRQEVEAQSAVARAASDEARRAAETSQRSADDQGQALREAQGKAEKLATELAAAQRELHGALFLVAPPAARGKELALAPTAQGVANKQAHRLVLQLNTNDPAMMTMALNNATNCRAILQEPRREGGD